jgi:predicted Zn-ribbon and HTH transcriptional regulator
MKMNKQCPKCQSRKIGHLESLLDSEGERDTKQKIGKVTENLYSFKVKTTAGEIEAYVCTECGYYETYVKDPKSVPWNDMLGFSWLE